MKKNRAASGSVGDEGASSWIPLVAGAIAVGVAIVTSRPWPVPAAAAAAAIIATHIVSLNRSAATAVRRGSLAIGHGAERVTRIALFAPLFLVSTALFAPWQFASDYRRRRTDGRWFAEVSPENPNRHRSGAFVRLIAPVASVALLTTAALAYRATEHHTRNRHEPGFADESWVPPTRPAALRDAPWADALDADLAKATEQMVATPFIGTSLRDYHGPLVDVTRRERRSYQMPIAAGQRPLEVWFFGGSTIFGLNQQRDDHTIPSEFARLAQQHGLPVQVRNFGVPSWVNMQETTMLSLLLSEGKRPDLVVFYDGINDIVAQLGAALLGPEIAGEPTTLSATQIRQAFVGLDANGPPVPPPTPLNDVVAGRLHSPQQLQRSLARVYGQGTDIADHLAAAYGFRITRFWQPTLYSRSPLPAGERALLHSLGLDDRSMAAIRTVVDGAVPLLPPDTVDLTGIFDHQSAPIFVDLAHTNELGARLVAEAMFSQVEPTLRELVRPPAGR